jgi:hypothetical protein
MNATQTEKIANELISKIEAELNRLGILGSSESPCACVVAVEPGLPEGWIRIYDDWTDTYGPASEILLTLKKASVEDVELNFAGLSDFADSAPHNSRDWPADKISFELLEEGTPNDQL